MPGQETESTIPQGPVDRAFRVLQTVVAADEPVGVRELSRRTGLPTSTTSRLVLQLERLRMVARASSGQIIPGSALATLQPGASATPLVSDRLRPLLVELASHFGEDAALAIDDGDALLYVAHASSNNAVSVNDVVGERHLFHVVAPGLVALARWDDNRLAVHLDHGLTPATPRSIIEPDAVRKRLRAIARDGFAWAQEEHQLGINGLAVPVDLGGSECGFISLYGPSYRFSPALRPTLARELVDLVTERVGPLRPS